MSKLSEGKCKIDNSIPLGNSKSDKEVDKSKVTDKELLPICKRILEKANRVYGSVFKVDHIFGMPIDKDTAIKIFQQWVVKNKLYKDRTADCPSLEFSNTILCSAKLVTTGPQRSCNKPEKRTFKLVIRSSEDGNFSDNLFMREYSFIGLLDHELGTHLFRNLNEGLQPWYSQRSRFNMSNNSGQEMLEIEEGLAAINTVIKIPSKLLWFHCLLYICPIYYDINRQNVKKTITDLSNFCNNLQLCARLVKRVDKGLGRHDQSYFIGAVRLLRNRKNINFQLLMSGRLLPNELGRVKRLVRKTSLKIPDFLADEDDYQNKLNVIAKENYIE